MGTQKRMYILQLLIVTALFCCTVEAALNDVLLVADLRAPGIYYSSIPSASSRSRIPVSELAVPFAADYDPTTDTVYASGRSSTNARLFTRFDSNGGKYKKISLPQSSLATSVAVDYLSKLVYYADNGQHAIWVTSLNLTWHTHLIINTYSEPRSLCLDPPNGRLYFTVDNQDDEDEDQPGRLIQADMDGGNQRVLQNITIGDFRYVTIDNNYLYWIQLTLDGSSIKRYSLNTQQVVTILTIPLQQALVSQFYTMAIADNYMYISTTGSKQLVRYSTSGGSGQSYSSAPPGNSTILTMVTITQTTRQSGSNGCSVNNGGCQQLCLPRPGGLRRCACSDGYVLQGGTTCLEASYNNFLIVSDFRRGGVFLIDLDRNATVRYPITGLDGTRGVTYADRYLYFVDQGSERVVKACTDDACPPPRASIFKDFGSSLSTTKTTSLQDIEIDSRTGYLYLIDLRKNKIMRLQNTTGVSHDLVSSNLDDPLALALDEGRQYLFWTDVGASPKIERVSLPNGNNRVTVISSQLGQPADIAVDSSRQIIYWCDATRFKIEQADYNGGNRKMVTTTQLIFTSIAIDGDYLYFKSYHSGQIKRINRFTGTGLQPIGASVFTYVSDMAVVRTTAAPLTTLQPPLTYPDTTKQPTTRFPVPQATTPPMDTRAFLFYTDPRRQGVFAMGLNGGNESSLFTGLQTPRSVDIDPDKEVLFIIDSGTSQPTTPKYIIVTNNRATNVIQTRLLGRSEPRQLGIDFISELIYYADRGRGIIGVYTYDLRNHHTLLYVKDIAGVVVDFNVGRIFYNTFPDSQTGPLPSSVYTAGEDGSNPMVILTNQDLILHLTLDYTARMIYWVGVSVIERCTYTGRSRQLIVDETAVDTLISAVAVDELYLYFSVIKGRYLYRVPKNGGTKQVLGPTNGVTVDSYITDIHVQKASISASRSGSNQCSNNNGGCDQMCLPNPNGRSCACGRSYQLAANRMTCTLSPFDKVLLVTDRRKSAIFIIDVTTNSTYPWRLTTLVEPAGIGWYPEDKKLFLVDRVHNSIIVDCWDRRTGCIDEVKEWDMGQHTLEDAEVDFYDKYIYIVDSSNALIFRTTLSGEAQQTIVDIGGGSPRSLALDLTRRLVFWTDIGSSPKIERANMDDGSDRVTVINTGLSSPNDIVLDPDMTLMYWCDGGTKVIEVASMTGSDRKVLFNEGYTFISLALDDESLYFFAVSSRELFRINRFTGGNKEMVGEESFMELFDMKYVDIRAPTTMKVNPPLGTGTTPTTTTPSGEPGMPGGVQGNSGNKTASGSGGLSQTTIIYIAVGVGGGVLLILIIVVGVVCCCLMSAKKKRAAQTRAVRSSATNDTAPQMHAPAPPTQNGAPAQPQVQPQPQAFPPQQYLHNPPAYPQPGAQGQLDPTHLMAQQMLQQNQAQKQQQAQMLMMQQQLLLLQAQQLKSGNKASQEPPPEKKGFHKAPMPLPKEDSEGKGYDLYVNNNAENDQKEDEHKDDYMNM